ncbi:MAG TPA: serine esterase [Verrucomicrobiae bacterium]|nr:serine esterase [Verrucomicrobiae bacterium]
MLHTEFHEGQDPRSKRLMVVLHGLGDSIAGFQWMPQAMNLPWLNFLLVNAPDRYYQGFSWYEFGGDPEPGILRSRKLLFELLDEQRENGFASEETIVSGFSQGCLMTWETGLRYPHRLAGMVGISGYAHDEKLALKELSPVAREQRFLITHGTLDPLIPFDAVKQQVGLLKAAGLNIEWREFEKGHTIAGEEELAVIRDFVRERFKA